MARGANWVRCKLSHASASASHWRCVVLMRKKVQSLHLGSSWRLARVPDSFFVAWHTLSRSLCCCQMLKCGPCVRLNGD